MVKESKTEKSIVNSEELSDLNSIDLQSEISVDSISSSVETKEKTVEKDLTDEEQNAAKNLHNDIVTFLSKTIDIQPEDESKVRNVIPTGIDLLDAVLGGGVGTKIVQFVGHPGCGKSALVSRILASGQRRWPGKFIGIYIDSEQSMSRERLYQLGVRNPEITPYNDDITVEKVFRIVEQICLYKQEHPELLNVPSCVIWDSIANTPTEKSMAEEKYTSVIGQKANVLSHDLPKLTSRLNRYSISLVCVNQLRERIEMNAGIPTPAALRFLADKNIPGGNSLLYNSFQLFFFRHRDHIKGEFGFDGGVVVGRSIKNKLFTPNIEVEMVFSFEHGFSNFWTNYLLLKKYKRITVGGGWVTLEGYTGSKCQQKGVLDKYKEDPNFRKIWDENVADVIKTEILEKYSMDKSQSVDIL
jgi:RecA/RadA recombinase